MSTKRPSRVFVSFSLVNALALAACSDSPSEPEAQRVAASLEIGAGDQQTASAGEPVALAPSVLVRDRNGAPLGGVTIRFAIVQGGGTLDRASAQSNAQGIAAPGRWTLGSFPGSNTLEASIEALPTVRFTATATSPYHITVRYLGAASAPQQQAVENAVSRWRSVIIRDLDDVSLSITARSCFSTQPAIDEIVDDLIVYIEFKSIDGAGKGWRNNRRAALKRAGTSSLGGMRSWAAPAPSPCSGVGGGSYNDRPLGRWREVTAHMREAAQFSAMNGIRGATIAWSLGEIEGLFLIVRDSAGARRRLREILASGALDSLPPAGRPWNRLTTNLLELGMIAEARSMLRRWESETPEAARSPAVQIDQRRIARQLEFAGWRSAPTADD